MLWVVELRLGYQVEPADEDVIFVFSLFSGTALKTAAVTVLTDVAFAVVLMACVCVCVCVGLLPFRQTDEAVAFKFQTLNPRPYKPLLILHHQPSSSTSIRDQNPMFVFC